jgi:mannose-6-phosphate isomerase
VVYILYPLKFQPVYKQIVWGGTNIQKFFKRDIPFDKVGESWELCCREDGMSLVNSGEFAGRTLQNMIEEFGEDILGTDVFDRYGELFPLLIKIIDANDKLSVQVHPNDAYARQSGEQNGKNELWYVIDAKKDAKLIYGLKEHITKQQFETAVSQKQIDKTLNEISVKPGDVIYIPAGTVHAILEGILIAEIQQNSNTTYRIYDWCRVDDNGKRRELHINQALEVINFGACCQPEQGNITERGNDHISKAMLRSEFFNVDELTLNGEYKSKTNGRTFLVIMDLQGQGKLYYDGGTTELNLGETVLVPANLGEFSIKGDQKLLLAWI